MQETECVASWVVLEVFGSEEVRVREVHCKCEAD